MVLGYRFWQRRFGGDPGIVGRSITLDGESLTIVGVMPPDVAVRTVELPESRAELWIPFSLVPGDRTGMGGTLFVVGRLAPGASFEQAQSQLSVFARQLGEKGRCMSPRASLQR